MARRKTKFAVILTSLAILGLVIVSMIFYPIEPKEGSYRVTKIIDGDTFIIETGDYVRLLLIDTPEKNEAFYDEAANFLSSLILGKEVRLEKDKIDRDKYFRLLRYVYVNATNNTEIFVNYELVRQGYAVLRFVQPDSKYREEIEKAREECLKEKFNLCNTTSS